jgi:hypothetical protein
MTVKFSVKWTASNLSTIFESFISVVLDTDLNLTDTLKNRVFTLIQKKQISVDNGVCILIMDKVNNPDEIIIKEIKVFMMLGNG